jgi:hypothetical protein
VSADRPRLADIEADLIRGSNYSTYAEAAMAEALRAVLGVADEWEAEADRYDWYAIESSIPAEMKQVAKNLRDNATALRAAIEAHIDTAGDNPRKDKP